MSLAARTSLALAGFLLLAAGCASSPPKPIEDPVWITRAEWSSAFLRDRDFIQHSCQVLRTEDLPSEPRSVGELRAAALSVAANAVVVEAREGAGDRTSFYLCQSLPSSVVHAPRGPGHGPPGQ